MIQVRIDTTVCEFLLGIPSNDPMIKIFNFVILNTKVYINNKKSNEEPLNLYEFKNKLKDKLETYEAISKYDNSEEEFRMTYGQLLQQM